MKARLKNGSVTMADVIKDPAASIGKMKVSALLTAMPGVGKVRAAQIMDRLGIAPNRNVRGLGQNQREALALEFEPAAA